MDDDNDDSGVDDDADKRSKDASENVLEFRRPARMAGEEQRTPRKRPKDPSEPQITSRRASGSSAASYPPVYGYRPGENLLCRICSSEPGGYAVLTKHDGLPGFLPTNRIYNVGDEVLATFVGVEEHWILLAECFTKDRKEKVDGHPDESERFTKKLSREQIEKLLKPHLRPEPEEDSED